MRKKDMIREIANLIEVKYNSEHRMVIMCQLFQKYIDLNYADSSRLLENELKFLRNL